MPAGICSISGCNETKVIELSFKQDNFFKQSVRLTNKKQRSLEMKAYKNDYEYWNNRASKFEKASCDMDNKCSLDNKMAWVSGQFNDTDTTLEIGCGTGIYSTLIANSVKNLIATDMSNEMLTIARTKLKQYGNVEIRREDCNAISYEDNTFDSILVANLIHIVTDPLSVLKEIRRVLKKDGRVIIISYTFYGLSFIQKINAIFHYIKNFGLPPSSGKTLSPANLLKIAEDAGFSVKESKLMGDKLKTVCLAGIKSD
jgi:ubiquinone/menaquinone biosynthesis C-methylase UbiE